MAKIMYYDLETTGVKPWRNSIHQISGEIEIDGEVVETFDIKLQPNPKAEIDPEALKIGNITLEDLKSYMPFREGYEALMCVIAKYVDKFEKSDKMFLCGYNNRAFDDQFLRGLFEQNNDKFFGSWFWSNSLDVMVLASQYLLSLRSKMENFKLRTVAKTLGIEIDESKFHDAIYDIEIIRKIYKIVNNYK